MELKDTIIMCTVFICGTGIFITKLIIAYKRFIATMHNECAHDFEKIQETKFAESPTEWGRTLYVYKCNHCPEMKTITVKDNGEIEKDQSFEEEEEE